MTTRERLTLAGLAAAILLAGAVIGASAVAVHQTDPVALLEQGAVDYAYDKPVNP